VPGNLSVAVGVTTSGCNFKGDIMHNLSRGIWTCAAFYVAIGMVGIFFLVSQASVATSTDGYGIGAVAPQPPLR
jgi:hypothetical protein